MMKNLMFGGVGLVMLAGCASGLNSVEQRQYMAYEQKGLLVKEKNPTTGAWLGLLPGGGSFYAREPGWGILNLLLWPASILWDPVSGYNGSKSINYVISNAEIEKRKQMELNDLTAQLATEQVTQQQYLLQKSAIESKYSFR